MPQMPRPSAPIEEPHRKHPPEKDPPGRKTPEDEPPTGEPPRRAPTDPDTKKQKRIRLENDEGQIVCPVMMTWNLLHPWN